MQLKSYVLRASIAKLADLIPTIFVHLFLKVSGSENGNNEAEETKKGNLKKSRRCQSGQVLQPQFQDRCSDNGGRGLCYKDPGPMGKMRSVGRA